MTQFSNRHNRATVAAGAALALSAWLAPLHAQKQSLVFVENSHGGDVSIIDAATLKVTGTIPIGASPDEIVASPSGDVLYLSRIVRREDGRPTGNGELVAIDPAGRTVLWRAPLWSGLAAGLTGVLLSVPSAVLAFLIFYYGGPVQFVMALALFPKVFQYARNVLCQVRTMPHVLAAHAKGLSAGRVFVRHILQVSLPSLVALAGVSVSMAFSAAIPVEVICDQPGIGQLAWKAALARDLPLLVTITFLVVVLTQAGNLLSDCATVLCEGRNA